MSISVEGGQAWGRGRLLAVLAGGVAAVLAVLVGLGFAVYFLLRPGPDVATRQPDPHAFATQQRGKQHRDQVAAAPMMQVPADAALPSEPAAVPGPAIRIPAATTVGPAQVPTGFPHTPQGAVGQLAAIEQAVLQAMSIRQTNSIHRQWALPGGTGVAGWPLTRNVQAFLGAARMGDTLDPTSTVVVTPQAALVKGTDGPDWVLACVLVEVRATVDRESRMGYGYCEAMGWRGGRWMIAPGPPAAPAPSTWPGSQISKKAGWRTWTTAGEGA
ncbi:hypothetical protein [Segeticoccus rhizosphaerae]|uniref:hypothetical protein n=1 Tax=Segeticoccus rhizosphaerae TaxID=1104777 RepID=UPI001264EF27|nr:hypothetical protein [Segeticoccus rhizosphaerae]